MWIKSKRGGCWECDGCMLCQEEDIELDEDENDDDIYDRYSDR